MDSDKNSSKLLELSDCLMMTLLSYLDSTSLYNLSQTCKYFEGIVEDSKLWRFMECRAEPNTSDKVKYCMHKLNDRTTHLLLKARDKTEGIIPSDIYPLFTNFRNIKILALEKQHFSDIVKMETFPCLLEELSLKGCTVDDGRHFFRHSSDTKEHLKVMILDYCNWIDSHALVCLGKYQSLEIISVVGCKRVAHHSMPYMSIAKNGFKKLKILDCRFTELGHNALTIFNELPCMLALYFQNALSYHLDQLNFNDKLLEGFIETIKRTEKNERLSNWNSISVDISDLSLFDLGRKTGLRDAVELPKSFLYQDPYGKCTCKDANNKWEVYGETETFVESFLDQFEDRNYFCKRFCDQKMKKIIKRGSMDSDSDNSDQSDDDCCIYGQRVTGRPDSKLIVIQLFPPTADREVPVNNDNDNEAVNPQENERNNVAPLPMRLDLDITIRERGSNPENDSPRDSPRNYNRPDNSSVDSRPSTSRNSESNQMDDSGPSSSKSNNASSNKRKQTDDKRKLNKRMRIRSPDEINEGCELRPGGESVLFRSRRRRHRTLDFPIPDHIIRFDFRNYVFPDPAAGPKNEISLKRLSLRGFNGVTDRGLGYLDNLNLNLLDLTYTRVTREGIESFLVDNPNCRVIHEKYCTCKPKLIL